VYLYRAIDQFGKVIDVLVAEKRDMAATRRFFARALEHGPSPIEVTTDHAPAYPRVLDELVPATCHVTEQYGNNPIECDHGRLKSRLRAMRGLKQLRCARVITAGHAFIQNTPPRPLRTGNRASSKPTGPGCLRRAGHGDLTNLDLEPSAALTARNATAPSTARRFGSLQSATGFGVVDRLRSSNTHAAPILVTGLVLIAVAHGLPAMRVRRRGW
jgi:hypothetical protein